MQSGAESGSFEAQILDSMSSGVVAVDLEGVVRVYNAGAYQLLDGPRGGPRAALGRDCRQVLAAQPGVVRLLLEALERKDPISRGELALEGGLGTIGLTLAPVRDARGEPQGAGMIFRDLAPIERQDERERLRERLAALGQMAAGLAHAIRNPLAGMEVSAGLLRRRLPAASEERELVDELLGELREVSRTVSQSLDFVRPAAPSMAPLDAAELLEDALAVARARVPFRGAVEWRVAAGLPQVMGDADLLRTVLTDLLVNALQAVDPDAGRLSLGVSTRPGEVSSAPDVVWIVADDGPGVPEGLREKIFYPFFTTKDDGSGVGLANAQKVVASHAGRLELRTQGGHAGCAFHLRLPSVPKAVCG